MADGGRRAHESEAVVQADAAQDGAGQVERRQHVSQVALHQHVVRRLYRYIRACRHGEFGACASSSDHDWMCPEPEDTVACAAMPPAALQEDPHGANSVNYLRLVLFS